MRTAIIVGVTSDGQLELPSDIQSRLIPGDKYIMWQAEDSIIFKKLQKQPQISELLNKIKAMGKDAQEPSLEKICALVKDVRHGLSERGNSESRS